MAEGAALEGHLLADGELQAGEEVDDFQPIESLQALGINMADIKKAKDGGCYTTMSIFMNTKKDLCAIKGLSDAKVEKIIEAARKTLPSVGWRSATEVMQVRQRDIVRISSGAKAVDELIGGGFETKALTEIYGEYRTGKTQLCMTMCVTCQMPINMGGGAGKVAFIDTEGTFRPEKIRQIAERFGLEPDAVLDNIICARAFTHEHQMDLIVSVAALMVEEPFKLLVVDSLTALFRTDFSGRGELAERQQKLNIMLAKLKKIAEEFNVAVVYTNQVVSDPGGGAMFVSDPKKPVGGHVVAHASTTRLSLRKGKAEQRLMKVVQSPYLAEAEASYQLGANGVEDFKD